MAKRRTIIENDIAERIGRLTWEDAVGQFIDRSQWYPLTDKLAGRPGKACGRNTGVHAAEKSDIGILPKKGLNNNG